MLSVVFASVLLRLCFGFVSKATAGITGTLGYKSEKLALIYVLLFIPHQPGIVAHTFDPKGTPLGRQRQASLSV